MTTDDLLLRIAVALERLVALQEREELPDENVKALAALQRQAIEQNERNMKATEEWRAVEREHMQRCERRYRLMMEGEDVSEPINH